MTGTPEEIVKWLFGQDRNKLFDVTEHNEKYTRKALNFFWACVGQLAIVLKADKWDIYLQMLKRYSGAFTYMCVKRKAVEAFKTKWRECEEIGTININGQEAVQLICYYGISLMNKKELSVLIDGVVSEMREMNLDVPNKELERILKKLEEEDERISK